jgi:hypothetical protein
MKVGRTHPEKSYFLRWVLDIVATASYSEKGQEIAFYVASSHNSFSTACNVSVPVQTHVILPYFLEGLCIYS